MVDAWPAQDHCPRTGQCCRRHQLSSLNTQLLNAETATTSTQVGWGTSWNPSSPPRGAVTMQALRGVDRGPVAPGRSAAVAAAPGTARPGSARLGGGRLGRSRLPPPGDRPALSRAPTGSSRSTSPPSRPPTSGPPPVGVLSGPRAHRRPPGPRHQGPPRRPGRSLRRRDRRRADGPRPPSPATSPHPRPTGGRTLRPVPPPWPAKRSGHWAPWRPGCWPPPPGWRGERSRRRPPGDGRRKAGAAGRAGIHRRPTPAPAHTTGHPVQRPRSPPPGASRSPRCPVRRSRR